ncbi:hypothetical protein I4U23_003915 [Adineta vaga]|nr:hypothetical protein I4U23_003915 [Adineta vaga]
MQSKIEDTLKYIGVEIERVIYNSEKSVHLMLKNLEEKDDVLNVIAAVSHQTDTKRLDEIENASFLGKIYQITIGNWQWKY